jgi:hypothetical protein
VLHFCPRVSVLNAGRRLTFYIETSEGMRWCRLHHRN